MTETQGWQQRLVTILAIVPPAGLALMMLSWLRYGIDLPSLDDWRGYYLGDKASLRLSDLFRPANDTLYPVGKALDALAQRFLDGNSVAYQFLSMGAVLGLLLWLQWRLLTLVIRNPLYARLAFCGTLLMMQPDGYWGAQNLAYHQALPLICLLTVLYVVLKPEWDNRIDVCICIACSLIAGFAYISGAFAMAVAACVLLAFALVVYGDRRRPLLAGGFGVLLGAAISVPAQLWVILVHQRGRVHRPDAPWTWPTESDFWLYSAGKIARSLLLPVDYPAASLFAATLIFVIVVFVTACIARSCLNCRGRDLFALRLGVVLVTLLGVTCVYLTLVAAGRAKLRPAAVHSALDLFAYAFHSFHFFWVTLLWPWGAVATATIIGARVRKHRSALLAFGFAIAFAFSAYAAIEGPLASSAAFAQQSSWRSETQLRCLREMLAHGGKLFCPAIIYRDLTPAYNYGVRTGASFARYFGTPAPSGPPLFKFSTARADQFQAVNMRSIERTDEGVRFDAGQDPMIIFSTGGRLDRCAELLVTAKVKASETDMAQLFFRRTGEAQFSEASSRALPLPGNGRYFSQLRFAVFSPSGFEDQLRLDAVVKPQRHTLKEIEVYCTVPIQEAKHR